MGVGAGLYMYDAVVKKFTFAISSPDKFLLPFESIQNHSPGLYTPYKKPLPNCLRRQTRLDGTADNADISQSQAASDDRLLSHLTLAHR